MTLQASQVFVFILFVVGFARGQDTSHCNPDECDAGFQSSQTCFKTTRCVSGKACSPPSYFTNGEGCFWLIQPKEQTIPQGYVIALNFTKVDLRDDDVVMVLDGNEPDLDRHALVWIQTGPTGSPPGSGDIPPVICRTGAALIELHAPHPGDGDHEIPEGFTAEFRLVEDDLPPPTPTPSSSQGGCVAPDPNPISLAWVTGGYSECVKGQQSRDVSCHYFSNVVGNVCCDEFLSEEKPMQQRPCVTSSGFNFLAIYIVSGIIGGLFIVGMVIYIHNGRLKKARKERLKSLQKSSMDILEGDESYTRAPSGLSTSMGQKPARQKYQFTRLNVPPPPPPSQQNEAGGSPADAPYRSLQPQQLQQFQSGHNSASGMGPTQTAMNTKPQPPTSDPPKAKIHAGYSQLSDERIGVYTDLRSLNDQSPDGQAQETTPIEVKQNDEQQPPPLPL